MNEIIQTQTIFSIVDCYCEAQQAVSDAFRLLSVDGQAVGLTDSFLSDLLWPSDTLQTNAAVCFGSQEKNRRPPKVVLKPI